MNPARLRQARVASGKSLRDLSEFLRSRGLSLSHAALHKYEAGQSRPGARALFLIAEALGASPRALLTEPKVEVEWLAYRRRASLTRSARDRITATATRVVEHQLEVERRVAARPTEASPRPRRVASLEDAERLALEVRKHWNLGLAAIESMSQTLEDHGGVVVEVTPPRAGFDGLSGHATGRRPVVVVNRQAPADRRRYTLAHELGHLVMEPAGKSAADDESLEHRFAGAFLVPAECVRKELGLKRRHLDPGELIPLKEKYGLSIQAWIRRAYDLEIVTRSQYESLCRQIGRLGWRRQEPGTFAAEDRPARLKQLLLRALAEGVMAADEVEQIVPGLPRVLTGRARPAATRARELLRATGEKRRRALAKGARALGKEYETGGALREFEAHDARDMADDSRDD